MEKYTIEKRNYTKSVIKNRELIQMYVVEIMCDSAADIPDPAPWWDVGSSCFIVADQDVKFLSSSGEWV